MLQLLMPITKQKHSSAIAFWLISYNFCANLANDIYLPSLPKLEQVFVTTSATLQLSMTSWFCGVAMPQLFLGPLSEKIGRKPVLTGGGICFLLATFFCAIANNVATLIIARFFQGVGVCCLNVSTFAIVSDLFKFKQRINIMSKLNICGIFSPLLGPILGGYIFLLINWRANFAVIFLLGFICNLGLWCTFTESNALLKKDSLKWKNIYKNYLFLLKKKGFLSYLIPYCLMIAVIVVYITAMPFIMIEKLHLPPQWFGYTQLPVFFAYMLSAISINYLTQAKIINKLASLGMKLIFFASFFMLVLSYYYDTKMWVVIVPMTIYALGLGFAAGPLVAKVMALGIRFKGFAAALLGFGMAMSCMLSCYVLSLLYNGTIFVVALLIFSLTLLAVIIFFMAKILKINFNGER